MKQYQMITQESLIKMSHCFSSSEEVATFLNHMADLVEELLFQGQLGKRVAEEANANIIMKQICILSLFIREHMELIQQLVASIDSKTITEKEMKKLQGE